MPPRNSALYFLGVGLVSSVLDLTAIGTSSIFLLVSLTGGTIGVVTILITLADFGLGVVLGTLSIEGTLGVLGLLGLLGVLVIDLGLGTILGDLGDVMDLDKLNILGLE